MRLRLLFSLLFSAMSFLSFAQVTAVGLIGPASPTGGWAADTDLTQDPTDTSIWTATMTLTAGECKFRANDDWAINWGSSDFPAGVGTQNGSNIPVAYPGNYFVELNRTTGAYKFTVISNVGIIGDATPNGWASDIDLYVDAADTNKYFHQLVLVNGKAKFRQDNDWPVNWGAATFPSGTGIQNGADIPVPAGEYKITFNKATGAYNFEEIKTYTAMGMIGTATGGGATDLNLSGIPGNPDLWAGQVTLSAGNLVFRANDTTTVTWGGGGQWPVGTASADSSALVVPAAGTYLAVFNSKTGDFKFFQSVAIIGDATPGGWPIESALTQDAADPFLFKGRYDLTTGEAKFRADSDWKINWGFGTFPTGTGEQNGANIPVSVGDYKITFNAASGIYNFEAVVAYDSIGLIGFNGPNNDWTNDVMMTVDPADEFHFTLASATVTTTDTTDSNQGVKFRANKSWDVNWGAPGFPIGVGVPNGPNVRTIAGTYRVDMNTTTGEYAFGPVSSTINLLSNDYLALSPNPTSSWLNVEIKTEELAGETLVRMFDMQGRQVLTQTINIVDFARIDVSTLVPGQYLVQLQNQKYTVARTMSVQR
jgi:starch-binding outer membrane protein SusE/F